VILVNSHFNFLQLIARYGGEADRHLYRCLFSHVDFSGDGKSSGKDFHQVSELYNGFYAITSYFNNLYLFLLFSVVLELQYYIMNMER